MAFLPPPSFEIARPPVEPPLHGLLDVAYIPDLSDLPESERDRWQGGITFAPAQTTCTDRVVPWRGWTDSPLDKAGPEAVAPYSDYHSYVLTYSSHCMVVPGQIDDQIKLAKDALVAGTPQAVESIFWGPNSGGPLADLFSDEGGNFSLSGSTPLVTGYGDDSCSGILNQNTLGADIVAFTPKQALLALTQALARCGLGARGLIHAPVHLAEDWAGDQLVRLSDNNDVSAPLITNIRGDYVVGGSGYPGTGPEGHVLQEPADGYAWAYASAPVGVLLSEPEEQETTLIDNRTNLHKIIVERTVAIAASTSCLFAAYVDVA
jgi:hypothetical protein